MKHQHGNALVVLNYNDSETTEDFIRKITDNRFVDHIVIVDNQSTDDSYKKLLQYADDKIEVIQTDSNGGYAKGNNFGAWYAINKFNPDYLLFSNPDVYFDEEAVCLLERVLMTTPMIGAVACTMNCISGGSMPPAWKLPTYVDCLKENLIVTKKLLGDKTFYDEAYLRSNTVIDVDVVPGSFFGVKKDTFREINGFDEDTFLYGEENLMAYKLKNNGYQSMLITNKEFLHYHSVSIDKSVNSIYKKLKMGFESRLIYANKVLHINLARKLLLHLTFYVGTLNYLILRKLYDTCIHK